MKTDVLNELDEDAESEEEVVEDDPDVPALEERAVVAAAATAPVEVEAFGVLPVVVVLLEPAAVVVVLVPLPVNHATGQSALRTQRRMASTAITTYHSYSP